MPAQAFEDRLGNRQRPAEMMARGVLAAKRDAFENLALCLFAKTVQCGDLYCSGLSGL